MIKSNQIKSFIFIKRQHTTLLFCQMIAAIRLVSSCTTSPFHHLLRALDNRGGRLQNIDAIEKNPVIFLVFPNSREMATSIFQNKISASPLNPVRFLPPPVCLCLLRRHLTSSYYFPRHSLNHVLSDLHPVPTTRHRDDHYHHTTFTTSTSRPPPARRVQSPPSPLNNGQRGRRRSRVSSSQYVFFS